MSAEPTRSLRWSGLPEPLQAASALHALSPELLKLTVEHISTRVAVIDRAHRYTYANKEAVAAHRGLRLRAAASSC
jgi:PAS domain-containing protein